MKPIDIDEVRAMFEYRDGRLYNRTNRAPNARAGELADTNVHCRGYRMCQFFQRNWRAHRIIYAIHHGVDPGNLQIDHINGDRLDNRIENLRLATQTENQRNRKRAQKNNKLGVQGVCAFGGKFRAQIRVDGLFKHLGYFPTPAEASAAYQSARQQHFGSFA